MSGLLLKDFYMIKKDCRWNFIIVVLFSLVGIFQQNIIWLVWPPLMVGMIPNTLLSLEEQSGWQAYADTMPWDRKTVVTEKYVLSVLLTLGATLFVGVFYTVSGTLKGMGWSLEDLLLVDLVIGILVPSVLLPASFKFGTAKGRLWYLVAIILAGGVGGGLSAFFSFIPVLGETVKKFYWLLFLLPLVILAISWTLAVKFYEKREL